MSDNLEFTGERYLPAIGGNIYLEHVHRYHLAKKIVEGKDVLDIASGEGFGTALLAESARSAIGVDISDAAVQHAQKKYTAANICFKVGVCEDIPLPSASVDVVVSFETLEHIDAHDRFLQEVKRVLRPGGTLVISTPEKYAYTVATKLVNPFHVKELFKNEFNDLLSRHFEYVSLHGQKIGFGSIIASENQPARFFETESKSGLTTSGVGTPMYMIGVASDQPLDSLSMNGVFTQDVQSSEPVLKRVEFEKTLWSDTLMKDIDHISGQVDSLQRSNWMSRASLSKLLTRLIYARLLYALSEFRVLSSRRRKRFLKSAEKRDPMLLSRKVDLFCLDYYQKVSSNKIIAASRTSISARSGIRVTAIVPNFNHSRYLPQRLDSILAQTYPLVDILVLDDHSSDDSRLVIESYVNRFPERIRAVYNTENSGNVFRQWQKGHSLAKGDLVWICESDDFCETTFVERMINTFRDPSVMMSFGRIQFVNDQGEYFAGLDNYREESEPGIWDARTTRPAAEWFQGGFGVKNVIANVGGSLWRRFEISDQAWEEARNFKVMGDWYLYSIIAGGGQIAYEPSAVSYFRIHESNTSGSSAQSKPEYYKEYARLMTFLKKQWDIPDATLARFIDVCRSVSRGAGLPSDEFERLLNYQDLRTVSREQIHVLVGILGFSFGGGEIFPIHLANALRRKGMMVSILQMHDADDHKDVRRMLDPGIPVYTANAVRDMGIDNFIRNAGISVVHSHVANVEGFLLDGKGISAPFITTLHGSYEAMDVSTSRIARWSKKIDRFAYTADRNLRPFDDLQIGGGKFVKIKNAMPVDNLPFPKTRSQLGIANDAIVFSLVARGAEGKGWVEAVRAYRLLRERRPDVPMALMMVGEGPATDDAKRLAAADPTIHFLGFVKEVYGLYRISDVALIPTRFPGESYPLCLIQALQVGVPCVSTDIGEIKAMSQINGQQAGIIIANQSNNEQFVIELSNAMEKILEKNVRDDFKEKAKVLGATYDIDVLAGEYIDHYRSVLANK
ncbi:methyltransferase domain-containing protein [Agrobacterium pusense]|uniref:methyltransferase domain-containing protein n=1 Tax=Agrobacterium pusense TaxID=648995 RepID=UPI00087DF8F3|nr:methyltransferase domain-containing protein [Agrobacterium pusense]OOO15956.1 glycosyl transferase family 1 [Agrobacterium pusense]WKD44080.1 methyltransferase domain-containing protein [Agrobacterium pusense]SDF06538.1 Glycosyltransferase involved in cell wall bisynthesis [Agrobacterium pusense]